MLAGFPRRQAWGVVAALTLIALAVTAGTRAAPRVNRHLPWHAAVVSTAGELQPWVGYDHVLRLGWSRLERNVPLDTRTGRRVYLNFAVFDDRTRQGAYWQHNPAELYASFVDSVIPWLAYSGDRSGVGLVREMLDYQLAHGTTPARWAWNRVPFPTSCAGDRSYGRCLGGMPRRFYGGVEPDKVGLLGLGYARFYELTGDRRYLRAAVWSATALARHVRTGDVARSPWPFRLDARTGRTLEHAEYGGMIVAPIQLFDELIRLRAGDARSFARARDIAWRWLLRYPLDRRSADWNRWSGHYEDIDYDPDDLNQAIPVTTARYLLTHPSPRTIDPAWRSHSRRLLDWVRTYLGRGPFDGAWAIDEQRKPGAFACCSPAGLGSDTARWAAAELLLAARTRAGSAQATGRRSLAYATYFMRSDGAVSCCGSGYPQSYWFSDGYADYLKSFSWGLAADPQLAPRGQDHILDSSSIVQAVTYAPHRVVYRTFAKRAVDVLRLSFVPTRVTTGGRSLRFVLRRLGGSDVLLRVRHNAARTVVVSGAR